MKINTNQLMSAQGWVCEEATRSIVKGIRLGDKIPYITVVRFEDIKSFYPDVKKEQFLDKYVIYNGNNRAKAYDISDLPIEVQIENSKYVNWMWMDFGELTSIRNLELVRDPELFQRKRKRSFYRGLD